MLSPLQDQTLTRATFVLPRVPPVPSTNGSALLSRWHLTMVSAKPWRWGTWYQLRGFISPKHQHPWVLPGGSPSHPPQPSTPLLFMHPNSPRGADARERL